MKSAEDRQTAERDDMDGKTWWQHLRHVRKRRFALLALLVFMTTGFIVGGFVRYTEATAALARGYDRGLKADAIVVLTGGAKRIEQAVSLLQSGHGQRLLISGVNPGTSRTTLARMTDTDRRLFDCCVDIDMAALDPKRAISVRIVSRASASSATRTSAQPDCSTWTSAPPMSRLERFWDLAPLMSAAPAMTM